MSILLWATRWAIKFPLLFFFRWLSNSVTSLRSAWLFWYIMTGITSRHRDCDSVPALILLRNTNQLPCV
ncbi:hypothetical protein PG984_004182 [Apiospora sp. TS-2023a]